MLSAYKLSRDPATLETAKLALAYVKTCQIFQPEFAEHCGAFVEETPQGDHIASRDTVEAVQGLVNMYEVTRDPVYLQRAVAGADWLAGRFLQGGGYPNGYLWLLERSRGSVNNDFSRLMLSSMAMVFAQLDGLLGKTVYAPRIPDALDWVLEHALEPDGALKLHDGTSVGHHAVQSGPLADCFTNDDGVGVALIAAYRATNNEQYREAACRNGRWWLALDGLPDTYASVPAALLFLVDMARFTGERAYVEKATPYIERVLTMQHLDPAVPAVHGGFRGEDVVGGREKALLRAEPGEYISHRTTMYSMLALAKVAAETPAEWNMAYSGF